MNLERKFGATVHTYRTAMNYTQFQLAELVGISTRAIQYIEKGEWLPKKHIMLKLMSVLNIPANEFNKELDLYVPVYTTNI